MNLKPHEFLLGPIFRFTRNRRMRRFERRMTTPNRARVLDIGGSCFNWRFVTKPFEVTLVNLYECETEPNPKVEFRSQKGNALCLKHEDESFDIAFSNSVIEHVGNFECQKKFAEESCRVARKIWIQTPAREFFMEPHFVLPFVHWLPDWLYRKTVHWFCPRRWGGKQNAKHLDELLDEIRLLTKAEFQSLFPDCEIVVERFLFLPKSYIAIRD